MMSELVSESDYLFRGFITDEEKSKVNDLIKNAIAFLNSLLEANKNPEMLAYLRENINFDYLLEKLVHGFVAYFEGKGLTREILEEGSYSVERLNTMIKEKLFDSDVYDNFGIYFLISKFKEHEILGEDDDPILPGLKGISLLAYDFFKSYSGEIEIVFADDELYNVPFVIQPSCKNLDSTTKKSVIMGLDRSNAKNKIISFMKV